MTQTHNQAMSKSKKNRKKSPEKPVVTEEEIERIEMMTNAIMHVYGVSKLTPGEAASAALAAAAIIFRKAAGPGHSKEFRDLAKGRYAMASGFYAKQASDSAELLDDALRGVEDE